MYIAAKEVFQKEVAKIASMFVAVMPSFIIWSTINIRVTLATISVLIMAYFFVKFGKINHIKYLLPILIAFIAIRFVKSKFIIPMYISMFLALLFCLKFSLRKKIIIVFCAVIISIFLLNNNPLVKKRINLLIKDIAITQVSYFKEGGGSPYKIYDEYVYQSSAQQYLPASAFVKAMPRGLLYFMLVPFPWNVTNNLRLYAYPQMILWYIVLPLSLIGILMGLRYKFKSTSIIIIFITPLIVIMSLV